MLTTLDERVLDLDGQQVLHSRHQAEVVNHCLLSFRGDINSHGLTVGSDLGHNLIVVMNLVLTVVAAVVNREIGKEVSLDCVKRSSQAASLDTALPQSQFLGTVSFTLSPGFRVLSMSLHLFRPFHNQVDHNIMKLLAFNASLSLDVDS